MKSIKPYFIEFIIVTAGVLIALFLNNFKESHQAHQYNIASIATINNEVQSNYKQLEKTIDSHMNLLDTLYKYTA